MKILIYGSKGFIGRYILNYFKKQSDIIIIEGEKRCENHNDIYEEISSINPDRVICCIGKSSGKNVQNTDFVEKKLEINLRDNYFAKISLLECCTKLNIHFTHIGDGSLYLEEKKIIDEDEIPNFTFSHHSLIKSYFEKNLLMVLGEKTLNIRLCNPITGDYHPKCLLTKLMSYKKILNKEVSVSILRDLIPILFNLVVDSKNGTYNLVNNESYNLIELRITLKKEINNLLKIEEYNENEHNKEIGKRSHVILSNKKIQHVVKNSLDEIISEMKNTCYQIKKCLCCGENVSELLNLNYQPLANDFHEKGEISMNYPLVLMNCKSCYHCQLSHSIDPNILFKSYKYVSGTSNTGLEFFRENANFIHDYVKNKGNLNVLDIACNDGSQLDFFLKLGYKTYGVEPAENVAPLAETKGHNIYCDFWKKEVAEKLPKMQVILAQNVFAHTRFVDQFLQDCKIVMDENTSLFIQTSQKNMIVNGEFDTTYHEHISFFNSKSMKILCERNDLVLNRILTNKIHGTSYIFEIKLNKDEEIYNVPENILSETKLGLYNDIIYDHFTLNAKRAVYNLKNILEKYTEYTKISFGAAAKSMTVLCYGNIDFDYIIDENPLKIGLYSPKLNIMINSLEYFKNDDRKKFIIVITAWNFADEIKRKILENKGNKEVIIIEKYFPEIIFSNI